MKLILNILLFFIDFKHKNKIIKFFKYRLKDRVLTVIDVGAHIGETISLFSKNFKIKKIICYEASSLNFKKLIKYKNLKNLDLSLNNTALGEKEKEMKFFQASESSSSTFCKIDQNSDYFKRKKSILNMFRKEEYISSSEIIKVKTLKNEFYKYNLKYVDILKIDTEGFEFDVIKGAGECLKFVNFILFEHHYDQMIIKNYKFSEINEYLTKLNFKKIIKFKMPLRKTFEYIYVNENYK
ncbi:FkbM family methyltransferase [Candidatus Pelagibacter sp.]|jgi:FkbM family methyltransferase|nr:FkbM family methyltransferase [Candidatus Pelagibacter sp.]MDB4082164.1 FkbM family methyltransferase [Candidatus Pelagibacter sp.]